MSGLRMQNSRISKSTRRQMPEHQAPKEATRPPNLVRLRVWPQWRMCCGCSNGGGYVSGGVQGGMQTKGHSVQGTGHGHHDMVDDEL
mmetsp:Transcript_3366/g.12631  ORF Transcript_3366/g.12631 Transcript_3366/m.12631 type:complete len:87 (+) Transcript_3366:279-539(+)